MTPSIGSQKDGSIWLQTMGTWEAASGTKLYGDYAQVNPKGALGRYQLTNSALLELGYIDSQGNWLDKEVNGVRITSKDTLLKNGAAQDAIAAQYLVVLKNELKANGAWEYVDKVVGGQLVTAEGLLAASWEQCVHCSVRASNCFTSFAVQRPTRGGTQRYTQSAQSLHSEELAKSHVKAGMLEITAPTDGIVKDLAPNSAGAVVAAGALLMNIVPLDGPLQAEVQLKNEDVGFVAVGQPAKLKVAAYPFQKYGLLEGRVRLVSADAADPKQQQQAPNSQTPSLAYRAILSLDSTKLVSAATGEQLPLSPGMLITAEVHQGSRSVLEYLLSPVTKVRQEAARER